MSGSGTTWEIAAKHLELEPLPERAPLLKSILNIDESVHLTSVYSKLLQLQKETPARLYIFTYTLDKAPPKRRETEQHSYLLLHSKIKLFPLSLKAMRKAHKVVESLEASSSGTTVVQTGHDVFDMQVSLFSRDPEKAKALLSYRVRHVLLRALCKREVSPVLFMGDNLLFFSHSAPMSNALRPEHAKPLIDDLLYLSAVLPL